MRLYGFGFRSNCYMEAAGQVRSVYLTMVYREFGNIGGVLHEIQISKDGMLLTKSTQKKPARPDRVLFDKTQFPEEPTNPFISGVRIGSKLHLFAGIFRDRGHAITTLGSTFDPKSLGEDQLVPFHDLPNVLGTSPVIMSAHGRLYHLAIHQESCDLPIHFEVYDPSTKSWALLTQLPRCPFRPYARSPRWYLGYAVWGTCILVSFGYPAPRAKNKVLFAPVLYNAESGTWHQVDVEDPWGDTFPWLDKAVVVGDTMYALGVNTGSIISFYIDKSGSEEDGTLVYSVRRPYTLQGLNIHPHAEYQPRARTMQCLTPLSDSKFCLVQTITYADASKCQPIWITTFKILRVRPFNRIQTLNSTFLFMNNQGYGHFEPVFCYNPDYEPKEVIMLTTTEDIRKERNMIQVSSNEVHFDILDNKIKELSLTNRKENGKKQEICGIKSSSDRVEFPMPLFEPEEESLTPEKVDMSYEMSRVKCSPGNVECLKPDFELREERATVIKGETIEINASPGKVDSNVWDPLSNESVSNSKNARRRRKKAKHSKKKESEGDSYFVSLVKDQVSIVNVYGKGRYVAIVCLVILLVGFLC